MCISSNIYTYTVLSLLFAQVSPREFQVYSHSGCMFVRNKICWYSSRLNPSFPLLSIPPLVPARHQPSFLFISAEFPPHQPHSRKPRYNCIPVRPVRPLSATGTNRTRPIPDPANPLPSAKHHGSHGGSYGINKSGAHAPQLPSLLPSAATSQPLAIPPLSVQRLRRRFNPPVFLFVPLPFTVSRSLASSNSPRATTRAGILLPISIDFVFPSKPIRVQIASTSTLPFSSPWYIHLSWNYV